MRKRKRFFYQKRQTVDSKSDDVEKISENIQPDIENIQPDIENKKTEDTSTSSSKPIIIIKYVYLIAFFALLAGIMAPIVNPFQTGTTIEDSYKGIGVLFVGLVGGIFIFKSTTSIQNRMTFLIIGFALMIISSVFIAEFSDHSFFRF